MDFRTYAKEFIRNRVEADPAAAMDDENVTLFTEILRESENDEATQLSESEQVDQADSAEVSVPEPDKVSGTMDVVADPAVGEDSVLVDSPSLPPGASTPDADPDLKVFVEDEPNDLDVQATDVSGNTAEVVPQAEVQKPQAQDEVGLPEWYTPHEEVAPEAEVQRGQFDDTTVETTTIVNGGRDEVTELVPSEFQMEWEKLRDQLTFKVELPTAAIVDPDLPEPSLPEIPELVNSTEYATQHILNVSQRIREAERNSV